MSITFSTEQVDVICRDILEISEFQFAHYGGNEQRKEIVNLLATAAARIGHDDPLIAWRDSDDFEDLPELAPLTYYQITWGLLANFTKPSNLFVALELVLIHADSYFQSYRENWEAKLKQAHKSSGNLKHAKPKFGFWDRQRLKQEVKTLREKHPTWSAEALASRVCEGGQFPVSAADLAKKIRVAFPDLPKGKAGRKPKPKPQ